MARGEVRMQLAFKLPEIDRDETRAAVEEAFEAYRLYKYLEDGPNVTAQYPTNDADTIHGSGFHSSTESAAYRSIDHTKAIEQMDRAVNRLSRMEREIMKRRYMKDEDEREYDADIMIELAINKNRYYKEKSRAFYKLAFALRIEIVKNEDNLQTTSG